MFVGKGSPKIIGVKPRKAHITITKFRNVNDYCIVVKTEVMLESSSMTTRSEGGTGAVGPASATNGVPEVHWDSASLGMDETELRDYFSRLRESIA